MGDDVRKPFDSEIDIFGTTHVGKVRDHNEDHYLVCSLHKYLQVHGTSLPDTSPFIGSDERLGYLAAVADGVGGQAAGEIASRVALETLGRYVTHGVQCYFANDPEKEDQFLDQLRSSVMECHSQILSEADGDREGMSTTITMLLTSWPTGYVVQVGDSRCYLMRDGDLIQLTKDQTFAQELVDEGLTDPDSAEAAWGHVLSSSVGGQKVRPAITRIEVRWDDVFLLCSDGLTKHVSDDRIRELLGDFDSAQGVAERLRDEALAGGGHDNVTVLVGSPRRDPDSGDE